MRKPQLFLLHFAGGNCYSFQFMASQLKEFELVSLELPGRGRRINETLLKDYDLAVQDIYLQITKRLTAGNFLIYGHSMGAYLALGVSHKLEREGRSPGYVIVSGNAGPGMREDEHTHLLEKEAFIAKLVNYGGLPDGLKEDPELFDFFEPILRADFEIADNNKIDKALRVNAPLFAMMGSEEEKVDKIGNWGEFTRSGFDYEILEGNHFFIHKHPQRIADIIKACYTKVVLS